MRDLVAVSINRRGFFRRALTAVATLQLIVRAKANEGVSPPLLQPTPAIGKQLALTEEETAGPFFRPRSPRKNNFREAGVSGEAIVLAGCVWDSRGTPVPGCLLDFWQADGNGEYDLDTFRCRGHQFTDAHGRYRLETVVPGLYPGRTRHFHVRFQAPATPVRSTQLYFPEEPRNAEDTLFRSNLLMQLSLDKRQATFNFVTG